jgi:TetR/AcrR family transcriptional regulator, acrAB operon repressor
VSVRRTKAQADQTREAVIDAAEKVFFQRGVSRASLEEVAQAAGVTRGAVYWHFTDKVDLVLAIRDRLRLPWQEIASNLLTPPTDDPLGFLEQSISKLFRRYATEEQKKVQLTIVLIRCDYTDETQHILEEVNKANCELISVFRTYFRKQLSPEKRGGFDAADLANLLGTAMVGAIHQSLRFPSDYRLDKHGVRAISQVFALIRRASLSGT